MIPWIVTSYLDQKADGGSRCWCEIRCSPMDSHSPGACLASEEPENLELRAGGLTLHSHQPGAGGFKPPSFLEDSLLSCRL